MAIMDATKLPPRDEEEEVPAYLEALPALRAQLPGRDLQLITMRAKRVSGDDATVVDTDSEPLDFVVTGPTALEMERYLKELEAAGNLRAKNEAMKKLATAQIRWPSREVVKDLFERYPGLPANFAGPLSLMARTEVEVTTKKL